MSKKGILFEPWALGDALIAASVLAVRPDEFVLVCQQKWHPIILAAINSVKPSDLLAIETSYEAKDKKSIIDYSVYSEICQCDGCPVYGIRGDVRDYYVAGKIFRGSAIHMRGWLPFAARKIPLFDLPYRYGLLRVKNRYEMWTELLGLDFAELEKYYAALTANRTRTTGTVGIHVGAQWRSKQFPEVRKLAALMSERGKEVRILAGQNDPLPEGISSAGVTVLMGEDLVDGLKNCDVVVTNDSGPMHLAALLGVRTVAVGLISNIDCWAPPAVLTICGEEMPKGYAPLSSYWSDDVVEGWPSPEKIVAMLEKWELL